MHTRKGVSEYDLVGGKTKLLLKKMEVSGTGHVPNEQKTNVFLKLMRQKKVD